MQRNLLISENPIKAVAELLSYALLAVAQMKETIKLMEAPNGRWHTVWQARDFAEDVQVQTEKLLRQYEEISAKLKEIGY